MPEGQVQKLVQDRILSLNDQLKKKIKETDVKLKAELSEVKREIQDREKILREDLTAEIKNYF